MLAVRVGRSACLQSRSALIELYQTRSFRAEPKCQVKGYEALIGQFNLQCKKIHPRSTKDSNQWLNFCIPENSDLANKCTKLLSECKSRDKSFFTALARDQDSDLVLWLKRENSTLKLKGLEQLTEGITYNVNIYLILKSQVRYGSAGQQKGASIYATVE